MPKSKIFAPPTHFRCCGDCQFAGYDSGDSSVGMDAFTYCRIENGEAPATPFLTRRAVAACAWAANQPRNLYPVVFQPEAAQVCKAYTPKTFTCPVCKATARVDQADHTPNMWDGILTCGRPECKAEAETVAEQERVQAEIDQQADLRAFLREEPFDFSAIDADFAYDAQREARRFRSRD